MHGVPGASHLEKTRSDAWVVVSSAGFLLSWCDKSWADGSVMEMQINAAVTGQHDDAHADHYLARGRRHPGMEEQQFINLCLLYVIHTLWVLGFHWRRWRSMSENWRIWLFNIPSRRSGLSRRGQWRYHRKGRLNCRHNETWQFQGSRCTNVRLLFIVLPCEIEQPPKGSQTNSCTYIY